MHLQQLVQWRFSSSTTSGVHVLDLENFQFSSVGKYESSGLWEQQSHLFGLSCWFYPHYLCLVFFAQLYDPFEC